VEVLLEKGSGKSWVHGWLMPDRSADAVLADNIPELSKLQDTMPEIVANGY